MAQGGIGGGKGAPEFALELELDLEFALGLFGPICFAPLGRLSGHDRGS